MQKLRTEITGTKDTKASPWNFAERIKAAQEKSPQVMKAIRAMSAGVLSAHPDPFGTAIDTDGEEIKQEPPVAH